MRGSCCASSNPAPFAQPAALAAPLLACSEGYSWGSEQRLPGHFPLSYRANQHFAQARGFALAAGVQQAGLGGAPGRLCWPAEDPHPTPHTRLPQPHPQALPLTPRVQPNSIEFDLAIEWRRLLGVLRTAKAALCCEQAAEVARQLAAYCKASTS